MGYASAVIADESALFNNPGAMGEIRLPSTWFAYEANAMLPGANRMAAGISFPTHFGTAGIGLFRFGDDLYSEQIASTGFANKLGIASLGARVNLVQYKAEGFGNKSAISVDFGGLAQITPQVSVGAYIINLTQSRISDDEYLPVKLVAGLGFRPNPQFIISTELEKDINHNATWRTGAEYSFHKKVSARTGFNLNPSAAFFGLGLQARRLKVDYAIQLNLVLGTTHQTSVAYSLEKKVRK